MVTRESVRRCVSCADDYGTVAKQEAGTIKRDSGVAMESFWTRHLPASVNRQLLPLKAHFFLYLAGQACVFPYLAVIGRQNGINAATIAIIFSLTPLTAVIIKPVCGFVIDRTQNATAVIVFLQVVLVIFHGIVFCSPSIKAHSDSSFTGYLNCNSSQLVISNSSSASCVVSGAREGSPFSCNLTVFDDARSVDVTATGASDTVVNLKGVSSICGNVSASGRVANETYAVLRCPCDTSVYSGNFWIYTVSVVVSWVCAATLYTVTDAAVCELLGDKVNVFGRQRLWGTISWGIVSPLIGMMIDEASNSTYTDYKPGFYVFVVVMLLDILLLLRMPRLRTADLSLNLFKDVATLFCNAEIVLFTAWTFIVGALIGVLWSFSTWYLEDLHASKLMIGLSNTVMSLCVEVPLFFVSNTILERIGYFFSYSAAFLTFSIKFIGYSYLVNPWYGLIVDIPGGAIFPLAYSAMTVFAKRAATPGTTASMMCILGSTLEGLGVAAGNMLGGMSIDRIGARLTFRYLGYVSSGCAVLCTLSYLCLLLLGRGRLDSSCRGYSPIGEAPPGGGQGSRAD
nr:major facilitator superfamily domain-containing protein 6-like isoform X1 [Rhipicephalus microplus]